MNVTIETLKISPVTSIQIWPLKFIAKHGQRIQQLFLSKQWGNRHQFTGSLIPSTRQKGERGREWNGVGKLKWFPQNDWGTHPSHHLRWNITESIKWINVRRSSRNESAHGKRRFRINDKWTGKVWVKETCSKYFQIFLCLCLPDRQRTI